MTIDWNKYTSLEQLEKDIKDVKIQGATNVALAVIHGMDLVIRDYKADPAHLIENVLKVGTRLSVVRNNEPLARNAVKHLEVMSKVKLGSTKQEDIAALVSQINSTYLNLITSAKSGMIKAVESVGPFNTAFTHCHSSTVEKILISMSEKNAKFKVGCSETRPLMQGRITATNLVAAGVDTTLIVDSASESFIVDKNLFEVEVVFLGADEITIHGDLINKLGSFGVAVSAGMAGVPVYVVASILKVNPQTAFTGIEIEQRNPFEVWDNPPKDLKIYNPAFEIVNNKLITGFITEVGIIKPEDIARKLHETYDWVF